jgi:protein-L-isoaspartate O-methyltransferase
MKNYSLNDLSDFRSIAETNLSLEERKILLKNNNLYSAPGSSEGNGDYQNIQDHSEFVDQIIGFRVTEIEQQLKAMAQIQNPEGSVASWGKMLHEGSQSWIGLNPRQLLTPYNELRDMCELLQPKEGSTLVDLGAGYGRMAFVLDQMAPHCHFIGYEIVKERVDDSLRLFQQYALKNAEMHTQDITKVDFQLPVADYYLIYDYGTVEHIKKTLSQLQTIARKHPMKVIGRGRIRHYINNEHPWLSQIFSPHHEETFSVYSTY